MTKRFSYGLRQGTTEYEIKDKLHEFPIVEPFYYESYAKKVCNFLNELNEENEQLKQFIKDLATKGTGRIDLANGYSYSVSAVLTNWKGDVE